MKSRFFQFEGENMNGIRQYLVDNFNSSKHQYLKIRTRSSNNSVNNLWDPSPSNHLTAYSSDNEQPEIVFFFPRGSFALTYFSLVFHNGPTQPLQIAVSASIDDITFENFDPILREMKYGEIISKTCKRATPFRSIKFQMRGENSEGQSTIFNLASFNFYGTYINEMKTCVEKNFTIKSRSFFILLSISS